jgi:hypothetical protein
MKKIALILFCASTHFAMADQTTICSNQGQERKIVLTENEQGCQVDYTKGAESKTLWSSARTAYCAPHAAEFIEKQKSWGFECTAQDTTAQNSTQ